MEGCRCWREIFIIKGKEDEIEKEIFNNSAIAVYDADRMRRGNE